MEQRLLRSYDDEEDPTFGRGVIHRSGVHSGATVSFSR